MDQLSLPFGAYLRSKRVDADLSLRHVASQVGISHVHLGHVERGHSSPLKREYWTGLISVIPGLVRDELERRAQLACRFEIKLWDAPQAYQELARTFVRRLERRDIPAQDMSALFQLLSSEERE